MSIRHPKSFPSTRLPHLTSLVRSINAELSTMGTRALLLPYPPHIEPPGRIESSCLFRSERCAVVNDAYPKSRVHMLVLPLDVRLQSLNDLRRASGHVDVLRDMKQTAQTYIDLCRGGKVPSPSSSSPSPTRSKSCGPPSDNNDLWRRPFIMGFHAIPSLPMLHMHVMTLDLESPRLKKRSHYNSFATEFFLPLDAVMEDLAANGQVTINQDVDRLMGYEKQPLECLWCGSTAYGQLPALKEHIRSCPNNRARP